MKPPVVVGVGGSAGAGAVLDWAVAEAALRGSPLHLVRACGPAGSQRAAAVRLLRAAQERCHAAAQDVPVVVEAVAGDVDGVLAARSSGAAAVVVGAASSTPWVESHGTRLAERSAAPVVVVRGEHGRQRAGDWPVLVAVRDLGEADHLLAFAFAAAARERRPLVVVHALDPGPQPPALAAAAPIPWLPGRQRVDRARTRWHARLVAAVTRWQGRYPDVDVRVEVALDAADRAVLERTYHAVLVVLGIRRLRGRGLLRHVPPGLPLLRPLEVAAARSSRCPVALVPRPADGRRDTLQDRGQVRNGPERTTVRSNR